MNKDLTRIAVLLDRSGSMASLVASTIDGFNEFLKGQQEQDGSATIKLVQFDDQYDVVFDKDVKDAPKLTVETFVPRGMTALNDAIGKTIISLGEELKNIPEDKRPATVVFAIITDGQENASKEYTQAKIAELVKHQTDVYQWDFVFIGANQDAVLAAKQFNIPAGSALTYNSNSLSNRAMYATLTANTRAVRASASTGAPKRKLAFSDRDRKNVNR